MRGVVLALLVVALSGGTARAMDPAQKWRTIETPHFYIHYYRLPGDDRSEEPVAQRLAVVAEAAHARLMPVLGTGKRRKTHVVLTDETDDYNGSASVLPYPSIEIFATSPDDRAELNDYDDWLYGLFMHEYTHILHIGTIGGPCAIVANALLGWGLGTIYAPNQSQPRYITEGLAVLEESLRTTGGRLRNSIWEMYLRAAMLEGRFERIDQFSNTPIQFPFGNSAYLYGSAFMRYVAETYGEESMRKLSRDYGSVCIPGGINRSVRHVTGKTWIQMYDGFTADLRRKYEAVRDAIVKQGQTPSRALTTYRPNASRPWFMPDGRVWFVDYDGYTRERLRSIDLTTGKARSERVFDALGGASASRDGKIVAFHAADTYRTFYAFNDVFVWDRARGRTRRLTRGMRATNPGISPDGTRVVFELNRQGARGLGLVHAGEECSEDEDCAVDVLIPAQNFEQVYTPSFSPDGRTVAFSWWRTGGMRDIWTMDLETRALTRITADRAVDMEPRFSSDGQWLYFVSDRTGVHNLYAYELATKKLYQATNVVNGVFDPAWSPDGKRVAYVGFVADGYRIEVAELDRARWKEVALGAETAADARPKPDVPPPAPAPLPSRRYTPWRTVFPWIFKPYAVPDGYGEVIGFQLEGSDVAYRHAWSLQLGFGTGRADDINFAANYSYQGTWPSLNLGVAHALVPKGGLQIDGRNLQYDERDWSFGAGLGLPLLRRVYASSDLFFSYNFTYAVNETPLPPPDPSALVPVLPETGRIAGLAVSWQYSDVRRFQYSVSPELGRVVNLTLSLGSPIVGSQYRVYAVSWKWGEHIPIPWPSRFLRGHVLAVALSGAVSGGDLHHRGLYFLGGYPPQDLLKSIYDFSRPGAAPLRGYPYGSVVGDQFHVLNIEYRFPIWWIERGYQTLPIYLRRLHAKGFIDYGGAFFGGFDFDKLRLGVGAELMLEITYAWFFPAALQLGYAHGFDKGGGNQVYFLLNSPF